MGIFSWVQLFAIGVNIKTTFFNLTKAIWRQYLLWSENTIAFFYQESSIQSFVHKQYFLISFNTFLQNFKKKTFLNCQSVTDGTINLIAMPIYADIKVIIATDSFCFKKTTELVAELNAATQVISIREYKTLYRFFRSSSLFYQQTEYKTEIKNK